MDTTLSKKEKPWQISLFALNNSATNLALFLVGYYSYFTQNVLGLAAAIVGIVATGTRAFDAITDPICGMLIDKTSSRFGKLRPFMIIGNLIIWICLFLIFTTPTHWSIGAKYAYTTILYIIYVIGYTAQNTATRAGQSIITNDPKLRPIFSGVDTVFTNLASAFVPYLIYTLLEPIYSVGEYADNMGIINPATWRTTVLIIAPISLLLTILAMIGISAKDRPENYEKVTDKQNGRYNMRQYWPLIKGNRPIQMLIIAASTDKIGQLLTRGMQTYLFANILLKSSLQGTFTSITVIPTMIIAFVGVGISRKFGLKRTFTIGSVLNCIMLTIMFIVGADPAMPIVFLSLFLVQKVVFSMASGVTLPMVADCTDYERYRTGKFVPGMMGTVFSFVDKLLSSLSTLIQGFALTLAGVGTVTIIPNQPVSDRFNTIVMFCLCIVPLLGSIASVISMKYYELDSNKMAEIRAALAEGKTMAQADAAS
ncbi:MAG: MFS transporter [Lachnospiraceae bacterium]